ncbi:Protein with SprT-like domain at the N terminus, variant 2 [Balamuthia mandrillaris]
MNEVLKKEEENREEKGLHQDLLFALQLQEEERYNYKKKAASTIRQEQSPLLFAEETLDPTPDLHALFIHFNHQFFDEALSCVEVKWSKRMTLCAGLCTFEGKGGLCCVKLSEPLLKFRPRSDLISTLLHEMIHAFLFITVQERYVFARTQEHQVSVVDLPTLHQTGTGMLTDRAFSGTCNASTKRLIPI